MSALDELERIAMLKDKGILSERDFNAQKKILLARVETEREKKDNQSFSFPEITREKILFAVALLGIFSVLSGIGLIIAANWEIIPALVKVALGLASLAASLMATVIFQRKEKTLLMESFLFVSFLLIGGNIALVQQTYHLHLNLEQGSFFWWLFSLPLIFFTRYRLIPMCSVGLIVFAAWDFIWDMNYMLVAGTLFLFMMLTHFLTGSIAKFLRDLAFVGAIFSLFAGDILSRDGAHMVGVASTILFLCLILGQPKTEKGIIRYYNYLFIFVAWRIFLLFWNAYYNLTNIGIMLIVFGTLLLGGVGLYTYYFQQIQDMIKRLVRHE